MPSVARALHLLRAVEQLSMSEGFPAAGAVHLVLRATASESAVHHLGHFWAVADTLSPSTSSDHASLYVVTLVRGYLREEPYAGNPHVRICEGEAEWLSYSTNFHPASASM